MTFSYINEYQDDVTVKVFSSATTISIETETKNRSNGHIERSRVGFPIDGAELMIAAMRMYMVRAQK